uniref:Peptidase S1 domain-containing protein n=1 Tax=Timema poppense TaxID=170557 RepID=A0A7R9HBK2_TIMPO|nr:unnamed protein product [Timema poppensis]
MGMIVMLMTGGGVPSVLQEVQVPIIENPVCQEMFQTAGHAKTILSSFLCAGYANGQKDSCEVLVLAHYRSIPFVNALRSLNPPSDPRAFYFPSTIQ